MCIGNCFPHGLSTSQLFLIWKLQLDFPIPGHSREVVYGGQGGGGANRFWVSLTRILVNVDVNFFQQFPFESIVFCNVGLVLDSVATKSTKVLQESNMDRLNCVICVP